MKKHSELKNISILIIGITKDSAFNLSRNIKKLLKLRKYFNTCDFYLFENNSKDNTVAELEEFKTKNNGFDFVSKNYSIEEINEICSCKTLDDKPCRIELISNARNILLNKIKPIAKNYDYILNIDLDVLFFCATSIINTLERFKNTDFDVITGCGITKWFYYRDAYAFRSKAIPYGPEYLGDFWWKNTLKKIQLWYKKNQKLPLYSGFGGAAIYKSEAYVSSEYSPYANEDFDKLQKELEISLQDDNTLNALSQKPIPNTNYNAPIVCEHVPFHYKMAKEGFDKIFLDTSWRFMFRD